VPSHLKERRLILLAAVLLLAGGILLFRHFNPGLPPGDQDNGGLFLPDGFESVVVVDSVGRGRHLAVRDNGDIYM